MKVFNIEYNETVSQGTLGVWVELLGNQEATDLLHEILARKEAAKCMLHEMAVARYQQILEGTRIATGAS